MSEAPVAHFFGLGAATGAEEAVAAGVLAKAEGATLDPADTEGLTEGEAEERCRFGPVVVPRVVTFALGLLALRWLPRGAGRGRRGAPAQTGTGRFLTAGARRAAHTPSCQLPHEANPFRASSYGSGRSAHGERSVRSGQLCRSGSGSSARPTCWVRTRSASDEAGSFAV
ncbi:hypothetical protein GCM10010308_00520 [Streptomyces vinaceusdrappus]|nr:hypothetical protein GCM10010308_00520 [Streptomyces vinaceusdrappus]